MGIIELTDFIVWHQDNIFFLVEKRIDSSLQYLQLLSNISSNKPYYEADDEIERSS